MGFGDLLREFGPPLAITAVLLVVLLGLLALLSRLRVAPGLWRGVTAHRTTTLLLSLALLFGVGLAAYFEDAAEAQNLRRREGADLLAPTNLVADPLFTSVGPVTSTLASWVTNNRLMIDNPNRGEDNSIHLEAHQAVTSSVILVRPGEKYRYSLSTALSGSAQVRMLWLDKALGVLSWDDTAPWTVSQGSPDSAGAFHTGDFTAPERARALRLVISNAADSGKVIVTGPKVSQEGVYVEPHPNGAQGALAFSFDWESAMGGAIHSKGMDPHDPAGAAAHGIDMRQGAGWLAALFADHKIDATFYATGYNLLDGNTERRTFSGDPLYTWANKKDGWATDYWTTHKWYSDDPYGTVQSDPAWYFGDQTRALSKAGHEIAPHTFGHLYVRGATPQQLSTDMDEWLKYAKQAGLPAPTTFAFPWRSSNSLTRDFYDVFYGKGIRAVTRVYESDLRDRYTLGAPYHQDKDPDKQWIYDNISVMPDFLLGSPSATMGEENGGAGLSGDAGVRVISRTLESRGTTSFWQHPEQLANAPELAGVRGTWEQVVGEAARQRDAGRLWIAPVASITEYQRSVMSVTTSLDSSLFGGWTVRVNNGSGQVLSGLTLTMPGDVRSAASDTMQISTVSHGQDGKIRVTPASQRVFPTRQIVLDKLEPGSATIKVQWAPGQEPLR